MKPLIDDVGGKPALLPPHDVFRQKVSAQLPVNVFARTPVNFQARAVALLPSNNKPFDLDLHLFVEEKKSRKFKMDFKDGIHSVRAEPISKELGYSLIRLLQRVVPFWRATKRALRASMESEADPSIRPVNLTDHLNVLMKGQQIGVVEFLYVLREPLAEFLAQ